MWQNFRSKIYARYRMTQLCNQLHKCIKPPFHRALGIYKHCVTLNQIIPTFNDPERESF